MIFIFDKFSNEILSRIDLAPLLEPRRRAAMASYLRSIELFCNVHKKAVEREWEEEKRRITEFNVAKRRLKAWIVRYQNNDLHIAGDFGSSDSLTPVEGETCQIRLSERMHNPSDSRWRDADRIDAERPAALANYPLFRVRRQSITEKNPTGPKQCEENPWKNWIGKRLAAGEDNDSRTCRVVVQLRLSETTKKAEIAALDACLALQDGPKGAVLRRVVELAEPQQYVYLTSHLPHLSNLEMVEGDLKDKLAPWLEGLDSHQQKALDSMNRIPEGATFVPGGPGAGKTTFALHLAALAQAGKPRVQVLYLLDINKPLTDAADKMLQVYRDLAMRKKVIRMFGWPAESRKVVEQVVVPGKKDDSSSNPPGDPKKPGVDKDSVIEVTKKLSVLYFNVEGVTGIDFTRVFLNQAERARRGTHKQQNKAPNLNEAAWQHFAENKNRYMRVASAITKHYMYLDSPEPKRKPDLGLERPLLALYTDVLREVDFIAATPVAASLNLHWLKPDIIVFDEAAHAREPQTLMPIAYFDAKATIFIGDHRQMKPFSAIHGWTDADIAHRSLVQTSSMARLSYRNMIEHQLLINHRAYGGLHQLPSDIFYNGEMVSGLDHQQLPASVVHLSRYLDRLRGQQSTVPRLVMNLPGEQADHGDGEGTSAYNPTHEN